MDKQLQLLSWALRGKQRREVVLFLHGEMTPTEVAQRSGYSLNHASKVLREFLKVKIVKLLNPEERTGRLYVLTDMGKDVQKRIRMRQK